MYRRSLITPTARPAGIPFTVESSLTADRPESAGPAEWIIPEGLADRPPQLVIMDVDSTFINEEVIDLLAAEAGVGEQVAAVTERAMRGELDFTESLHARVATLRGLDAAVLDATAQRVTYTPGVPEFVSRVQEAGGRVALVSGGFTPIVRALAAPLGITDVLANHLDIAAGRLTGTVSGEIVTKDVKVATLKAHVAEYGLDPSATIAIGDGSNDSLMVTEAALGVAFCAKPALREVADVALDIRDMRAVWSAVTGESWS